MRAPLLLVVLLAGAAPASAADENGIVLAPAVARPGDAVLVRVTLPPARPPPTATLAGRPLQLWRKGDELWSVAALPLETPSGTAAVELVWGTLDMARSSATLEVVEPGFPSKALTVAPKFVTPPASVKARIARDKRAFAAAYDRPFTPPLFAARRAGPRRERRRGGARAELLLLREHGRALARSGPVHALLPHGSARRAARRAGPPGRPARRRRLDGPLDRPPPALERARRRAARRPRVAHGDRLRRGYRAAPPRGPAARRAAQGAARAGHAARGGRAGSPYRARSAAMTASICARSAGAAARMSPVSSIRSPPSVSVTVAPASRAMRIPGATSHGLSRSSQNPSNRPAAT